MPIIYLFKLITDLQIQNSYQIYSEKENFNIFIYIKYNHYLKKF